MNKKVKGNEAWTMDEMNNLTAEHSNSKNQNSIRYWKSIHQNYCLLFHLLFQLLESSINRIKANPFEDFSKEITPIPVVWLISLVEWDLVLIDMPAMHTDNKLRKVTIMVLIIVGSGMTWRKWRHTWWLTFRRLLHLAYPLFYSLESAWNRVTNRIIEFERK